MRIQFAMLLVALTLSGFHQARAGGEAPPKSDPDGGRRGYVLRAGEGETVLGGEIVIKASPKSSSPDAAMFTQTLAPNSRIPLHQHGKADEFFFVHEGTGTAVIGGERVTVGRGDVIFVPRGTDHKIENFGSDDTLELVYFVSEAGLDEFFREVQERTEEDSKPLTLDELNEIAARHGDLYKEW